MNGISLARAQGVAVRGHDHAERGAAVPFQLDLVKTARRRGHHHLVQIGFQPHHDRLGFRVTHAAVEFERRWLALCIDHQAGIQKASEGNTVFFHALDGRQNNLAHGAAMHRGRYHWRG